MFVYSWHSTWATLSRRVRYAPISSSAQHYVAKVDFYDAKCNRVTQLTLGAQHVGVVVFHSIMRLHIRARVQRNAASFYMNFSALLPYTVCP
jgi:hypothetical protein